MLEQSSKSFKTSLCLLAGVGVLVFGLVTYEQSFTHDTVEIIQPTINNHQYKKINTPVSTVNTVPPSSSATSSNMLSLTEAQLEIKSIQEQVRTGAISKEEGDRQMLELIKRIPPTVPTGTTTAP